MEEQGILGQLLRVRACVLVCESERERGGGLFAFAEYAVRSSDAVRLWFQ